MLNFDYRNINKILYTEADESENAEGLSFAFLFMCPQPYIGKKAGNVLRDVDLKILNLIKDKKLSDIAKYYEDNRETFNLISSLRWKFFEGETVATRELEYSKDYITVPEIRLKDKPYPISPKSKCGNLSIALKQLLDSDKLETDIPKDKFIKLLELLKTSLYREKSVTDIFSREGTKPFTRDLIQIIAKWAEGLSSGESVVGYSFYDDFLSDKETKVYFRSKVPAKEILEKANLDISSLSIDMLLKSKSELEEVIGNIAEDLSYREDNSSEKLDQNGRLRQASNIDIQTGSKPDLSYDYDAITGVKKEPEESISPLVSNTDKYWEMSDEREEISEDQLENIQKIPKVSYIQFLSEYKNATKVELNDISQATALKTNLNKVFTGKALHSLLTEFDNLTDFNSALSGQHYDPISILLKIIPSVNQSKIVLVKALYSEKPLEIKDKFKDQKFGGESTVMNSELGELYYSDLESEDGNQGVEEKDSEDEAMEESLTEASDRKVIYLSILGTDTKEDAIPVYKLLTGNSSLSYFDMETSKPYTIKNLEVVELHMIEDYKIQNILSGKDDSFCIIRTFTQGAE